MLATTEVIVQSAIGSIKLEAPNNVDIFLLYYNAIKDKEHATSTFANPGQDRDMLYKFNNDSRAREVDCPRQPDTQRTRV